MGLCGKVNIKSFCFNPFRENSYLLWNEEGGECVFVDPGCYDEAETGALKAVVASHGLTPKAIWLTHGHFDHIFGVAGLARDYSIPVFMSPEDKMILERDPGYAQGVGLNAPDVSFKTEDLVDGQILRFAQDDSFKVIATPGHTPGGVCFYCEGSRILFSGDTLFAGAIGRTDLDGGDYDKEIVGIMEKLMLLPGDVEVYPGHGPATSIAEERTTNPFLQPFNEPWETEEYI
ncbi:MAG: MBL fold metallo-hydrolase [Bacteroidales bacterium]|nr:MBL fold metallo-hydrolase [Bacteroidales bacterium]